MKISLTESAIARARAEAVSSGVRAELADAKHAGLRLRITPPSRLNDEVRSGWYLTCRDRMGRMRRFPLGLYPQMGVSEARDAARTLLVKVRHEGADPIRDRQRDRAIGKDAAAGVGTLKAALEAYASGPGARLKSWPASRKRVETVFAKLLDRPVAVLTSRDLQAEADAYAFPQSASLAVRTLRPALKWLSRRGQMPVECALITQPEPARTRERMLSREELAKVLPVLRAADTPHARMALFLLWTLARRNEAGQATWGAVDLGAGTWTIPATHSKNKKAHIVPLPRQAIVCLKASKPKEAKPDALVFSSKSGTALGGWDRWTKALQSRVAVESFCRHDLRRTGATMLGDLGFTPDITEAALNHTVIRSSLSSRYNQSRYRPQVAVALQALADELDAIVAASAPSAGSNVEGKRKTRRARIAVGPSRASQPTR